MSAARTGRQLVADLLGAHRSGGGLVLGERVGADRGTPTPLSEASSIGLAGGLALAGKRVVVELVEARGLFRAMDALQEIGDVRGRSGGVWTAPVVVTAPLGDDEPLPGLPPGWRLAVAARPEDAHGLLDAALAGSEPTVLLLADAALEGRSEAVGVPGIGVPVVVRAGAAATLAATGAGVSLALEAAALLAAEGVEAEVLDLRGGDGSHPDAVASARKTGRVVLVGHGASWEALLRGAFWRLEAEPALLPAGADAAGLVRLVHETLEA